MTDDELDELMAPVLAAMREAFRKVHSEATQAAVQKVVDHVSILAPMGAPVSVIPMTATAHGGPAPRAPRGLVDDVLEHVLSDRPGMSQEEVEAAVAEVDDRIAPKSVYNKLRWWEKKGQRFRRHRGRWYRIEDIPPPWADKSSPEGETGGSEPPASFDL